MSKRCYNKSTEGKNQAADQRQKGVRLGRMCIAKKISVAEIADLFGVSKVTVYNWFMGKNTPREIYLPHINTLLEKLR